MEWRSGTFVIAACPRAVDGCQSRSPVPVLVHFAVGALKLESTFVLPLDREIGAHLHNNRKLHLHFSVGIDVVLHPLLLSECFSIRGSLKRCHSIFFFNRITFFHEHDFILPRCPSAFGFRRLTVLGDPHILFFYSFVAPLGETFFDSVANPVEKRACRWYIDLRATLRSSMAILTTFVTCKFLFHPTL